MRGEVLGASQVRVGGRLAGGKTPRGQGELLGASDRKPTPSPRSAPALPVLGNGRDAARAGSPDSAPASWRIQWRAGRSGRGSPGRWAAARGRRTREGGALVAPSTRRGRGARRGGAQRYPCSAGLEHRQPHPLPAPPPPSATGHAEEPTEVGVGRARAGATGRQYAGHGGDKTQERRNIRVTDGVPTRGFDVGPL